MSWRSWRTSLLVVVKWRGVGVRLEFQCDKAILGGRTEGLDETWHCPFTSDSLLTLRLEFHGPEAGTALYTDSVPKWSRLLHCLICKASFILWVHWRSASAKGRYSLRSSLLWGVTKVDCYLITDVSGQPFGPIFKGQAVQSSLRCMTSRRAKTSFTPRR